MFQIDVSTAASTQPASTALGTVGYFTDGNAATGVPATVVPAEFLNAIMLEMMNTITGAGLTLSKSSFNQLLSAIQAISLNEAKSIVYGPQGIINVTGAAGLGANQANSNVALSGSGSYSVTLPPAAQCPSGSWFMFFNSTQTGGPTIQPNSGDSIYVGGVAQNIQVLTDQSLRLVSDGAHNWYAESNNIYGYTPPMFDATSKLATTAYVDSMLGNMRGFMVESASAALSNSQAGSVVEITATTPITITLPTAVGFAGQVFGLYNASNATHTLATFGPSEKLNLGTTVPTSISVPPWTRALLIGDGTNWIVIGDLQAPYSSVFSNWTTAPQFDNSGKLANTAFVQRALGSFSGSVGSASAGGLVLSASNIGNVVDLMAGYSGAVTLPPSSGLQPGAAVIVYNGSGAAVTVQRAGSDTIFPNGTSVTSVSLSSGDSMLFVLIGSSSWVVCGGAGQLAYSSLFASSMGASGYQKLPSGLIIQWGTSQFSTTGLSVVFPIAFPNGLFAVTLGNPDSVAVTPATSSNSNTGFVGTISSGSAAYIYWIAIGH